MAPLRQGTDSVILILMHCLQPHPTGAQTEIVPHCGTHSSVPPNYGVQLEVLPDQKAQQLTLSNNRTQPVAYLIRKPSLQSYPITEHSLRPT